MAAVVLGAGAANCWKHLAQCAHLKHKDEDNNSQVRCSHELGCRGARLALDKLRCRYKKIKKQSFEQKKNVIKLDAFNVLDL